MQLHVGQMVRSVVRGFLWAVEMLASGVAEAVDSTSKSTTTVAPPGHVRTSIGTIEPRAVDEDGNCRGATSGAPAVSDL